MKTQFTAEISLKMWYNIPTAFMSVQLTLQLLSASTHQLTPQIILTQLTVKILQLTF